MTYYAFLGVSGNERRVGFAIRFPFFVAMDTLAYSFFKEITTSLKWFLLSLGDMTINCLYKTIYKHLVELIQCIVFRYLLSRFYLFCT
jgi:hypothetical protein